MSESAGIQYMPSTKTFLSLLSKKRHSFTIKVLVCADILSTTVCVSYDR